MLIEQIVKPALLAEEGAVGFKRRDCCEQSEPTPDTISTQTSCEANKI
jgi:hypothetical protein